MLEPHKGRIERASRDESALGGQMLHVAILLGQQLLGILHPVAVQQRLQVAAEVFVDHLGKVGRIGIKHLAELDKVDVLVQVDFPALKDKAHILVKHPHLWVGAVLSPARLGTFVSGSRRRLRTLRVHRVIGCHTHGHYHGVCFCLPGRTAKPFPPIIVLLAFFLLHGKYKDSF